MDPWLRRGASCQRHKDRELWLQGPSRLGRDRGDLLRNRSRSPGKGYATEAAEALVSYALADPRVRVVRAHTFEKANASTRVLTKCGFGYIGEVIEPEDGLVWRWEKRRDEAAKPSGAADPARM